MRFKIGNSDKDKNGWRWRLEFTSGSFYHCDIFLPEDDEYIERYCGEYFTSRKEYKKHLATHSEVLV